MDFINDENQIYYFHFDWNTDILQQLGFSAVLQTCPIFDITRGSLVEQNQCKNRKQNSEPDTIKLSRQKNHNTITA